MKKIITVAMIVLIYLLMKSPSIEYIPSESIRFRIIPNSNNIEDIFIKEKVMQNISDEFKGYNYESIIDARKMIEKNINSIETKVQNTLLEYNYDKGYDIKYGYNYFPKKEYNNEIYDEGYYESLVIELGEAKGDNFWCVLFPPLCLLEIEETEKDEIEYAFFLTELINKIFK